jgi:hypothetical protein
MRGIKSIGQLLNISFPWPIQAQEETAIISWRECSKKSVQQGRSHFDARSVHGVREHGKMARTPLAAFFNIPFSETLSPRSIPAAELVGKARNICCDMVNVL